MFKAIKQYQVLSSYERLTFWNYLTKDFGRILVSLAFFMVAGLTALGVFNVAHTFFYYFQLQERVLKEVIFLDTLHTSFFFLFFLLTTGSIITTFTLLFSQRNRQFLFSLPINQSVIFSYSFMKIFSLNLIGITLIAIPALVAFGIVWSLSFQYYATVFFLMLALALLSCSLGVILVFAVGYILPRKNPKLITFASVVFSLLLAYLMAKFLSPSPRYIEFWAEKNLFSIDQARRFSLLIPSTWFAEAVFSFAFGQHAILKNEYNLILFVPLLLSSIVFLLGRYCYYNLWTQSLTLDPYYLPEKKKEKTSEYKEKKVIPFILRSPLGAIIEKDLLLLFRSLVSFSKSFMLLIIFVMYFFIIYFADKTELSFDWKAKLLGFTFGVFGYLMATLSLYFVFPAISNEGQSIWLIRSAPLTYFQIYFSKIISWILLAIPFVGISLYFAVSTFSVSSILLYLLILLGVLQAITVIAISYSIGAAFPIFDETDIEIMSTSMQGITTTCINLAYVGFIGYQTYLFSLGFMENKPDFSILSNLILISLLIITTSLFVSYKKFKKII